MNCRFCHTCRVARCHYCLESVRSLLSLKIFSWFIGCSVVKVVIPAGHVYNLCKVLEGKHCDSCRPNVFIIYAHIGTVVCHRLL